MMANNIPLWVDVLASLLLVSGGLLALIGSLGLLRLPDLFARIHGPTLGNTLGLACVLSASILMASVQAHRFIFQELLIWLLVVATSPLTAMLIIRAGIYRDRKSARRKGMDRPDKAVDH